MKKVLTFSMAILFMVITLSGISSAQINQEIDSIEVRGNDNISEADILEQMELESGEVMEEEQLQNDLQKIFDLGYFQNLKPDFEETSDGINIIIEVVENPRLREVEFDGTKVFEKSQLLEWLGLESGEVININQLREGVQKLEREYQEAGYVPTSQYSDGYHFINYDAVDINEEGDITIPIDVGRLNDISLEGNKKTQDFVILRELGIEEGEVLQMDELRKDLQELYRLNYFEEINPEVERRNNSNKVDLIVNMVERKTGTLNFGGGYGTDRGWFGLINVREENLLGKGQTVGFEWEFGTTDTLLNLEFEEPRVFGSETSFGIDFNNQKEEREDSDDDEFMDESTGGSLTLGHPLNEDWRGSVRLRGEDWEKNYYEDDAQNKNDEGKTRSITLQGRQDNTNHPFNPTSGTMNTLSWEHGSEFLGGDQQFNKLDYDGRKFVEGFKEDHAWALRLKTGFGSDNLEDANEEYKLGGSENLRGYRNGEFDGSSMALLNVEYRFPIQDNFTGVVFSDTGNTWDTMNDIDLGDLRYSAGLGVRMNTPVGQIRLDYGVNDEGSGRPHFSIGQTF